MVEGYTTFDMVLICLALILIITIVWTIIVAIIYKIIENKKYLYLRKYYYENCVKEEKVAKEILNESKEENKIEENKVEVKKKSDSLKQETYVKIRFYKSDKKLIYVAPKNIDFTEGQKIKVKQKDGTVKTAVVVKPNYTRNKYKSFDYETLEIDN